MKREPAKALAVERSSRAPAGSGPGDPAPPRGPERTCLGCRACKSQAELDRLALQRSPEGLRVVWDLKRRLGGRGAWLCRGSPACLAAALKKRAFGRAFRTAETIDFAALAVESPGVSGPGGQ